MNLLLTDPPTKKTLFHLPLYYSIDSGDYTITPMNVIRNMNTKHGKKIPTPAAKLQICYMSGYTYRATEYMLQCYGEVLQNSVRVTRATS